MAVSDTHGHTGSLIAALNWGKKHKVDVLAFLGDGTADLPEAAAAAGFTAPLKIVRGNTDGDTSFPYIETLDFAGHVFFLTHGHLFGINEGPGALSVAAKSAGCGAALYGHTHIPFWEEIAGILVLNPGSAGRPRSAIGASFATIECPPGKWFIIRYWGISHGKTIREIGDLQGGY
ncbi:MAG: metallophosphoesterase [Treponema sp.]|nr:metallophosphoesterase [Treponema sp.]